MPPAGGFGTIKYKRNLPLKGPSGLVMLLGVTAVCGYGMFKAIQGIEEQRFVQMQTWSFACAHVWSAS
jgi:NADH dehydrogenase (ubiquinone) 1 alpha subcomplex subunit 13